MTILPWRRCQTHGLVAGPCDHSGKEWDSFTQSWVRRGWVAERQAIMDAEYDRWLRGERNGATCTRVRAPDR